MTALIATELLKLRLTLSIWVFAAAAVLVAVLRMSMVVLAAGTVGGVTRGTPAATTTMVGAAGVGTLLAVLLGTTAITAEFRHATITATVLGAPRRRAIVLAKFLAYALAGGVLGIGLAGLALVGGRVTGVSAPLGSYLLHSVAALVLAAVFLSALGVGIGLLIRNHVVALVVPLVWLLVVEPLSQSFGLVGLRRWLPGTLTGELGPQVAGALPPWIAGLILTGYCVAMAVVGIRRLQRLDIS